MEYRMEPIKQMTRQEAKIAKPRKRKKRMMERTQVMILMGLDWGALVRMVEEKRAWTRKEMSGYTC